MPTVDIGSGSDHLRFTRDVSDAVCDYLVVELRVNGLSASRSVYGYGWGDLAAFFDRMVADWRGWDGARTLTSIEDDLGIEARHEHGHVQVRVTLQQPGEGWGNHGWTATADFTL
jgi:hypothetical protein